MIKKLTIILGIILVVTITALLIRDNGVEPIKPQDKNLPKFNWECREAGFYWYNNACQREPHPDSDPELVKEIMEQVANWPSYGSFRYPEHWEIMAGAKVVSFYSPERLEQGLPANMNIIELPIAEVHPDWEPEDFPKHLSGLREKIEEKPGASVITTPHGQEIFIYESELQPEEFIDRRFGASIYVDSWYVDITFQDIGGDTNPFIKPILIGSSFFKGSAEWPG